jgi:hypothetical protein
LPALYVDIDDPDDLLLFRVLQFEQPPSCLIHRGTATTCTGIWRPRPAISSWRTRRCGPWRATLWGMRK